MQAHLIHNDVNMRQKFNSCNNFAVNYWSVFCG
jgi:hypothetical protein